MKTSTGVSPFLGCIFCYKKTDLFKKSLKSETVEDNERDLQKRFFTLLFRYLNREGNEKDKFLKVEDIMSTMLRVCQDCTTIVEEFCNLYHQIKCLELRVNWQIDKLWNVMRFADLVPLRIQQFRQVGRNDGNLQQKIDDLLAFRQRLKGRCKIHKNNIFPRVLLSHSKPDASENVDETMEIDCGLSSMDNVDNLNEMNKLTSHQNMWVSQTQVSSKLPSLSFSSTVLMFQEEDATDISLNSLHPPTQYLDASQEQAQIQTRVTQSESEMELETGVLSEISIKNVVTLTMISNEDTLNEPTQSQQDMSIPKKKHPAEMDAALGAENYTQEPLNMEAHHEEQGNERSRGPAPATTITAVSSPLGKPVRQSVPGIGQCKAFSMGQARGSVTQGNRSKGGWPRKCNYCGKVCRSKAVLRSHESKMHSDMFGRTCSICSTEFRSKNSLLTHNVSRHIENLLISVKLECLSTDQFKKYVMLMVSQTVKSFEMPANNESKSNKSQVKYKCTYCSLQLASKQTATLHLFGSHKEIMEGNVEKLQQSIKPEELPDFTDKNQPPSPHACPGCSKAFSSKAKMKVHMRSCLLRPADNESNKIEKSSTILDQSVTDNGIDGIASTSFSIHTGNGIVTKFDPNVGATQTDFGCAGSSVISYECLHVKREQSEFVEETVFPD